jgi:hypothetical protein
MSGFLVLHWRSDVNPAVIDRIVNDGASRLHHSHPAEVNPKTTILADSEFWCARHAAAEGLPSRMTTSPEDGSWIFTFGPASYLGKRMSERLLLELLRDITHDPAAAARAMDGVFAAVAFDRPRRRLFVVPSALGACAVYMRVSEEGVIGLSSSLLALAALGPVTLDDFTCQTLHRCGHRLPPYTIFTEIQSVPEGSLIELSAGRSRAHRYWAPNFTQPAPRTIHDAADRISQELANSCSVLIDPRTSVFSDLTGGFDSRVSTACLLKGQIPFTATVAGGPDHPDVCASQRICEAERIPLAVVDPAEDPGTLAGDIDAALLLSEGCIDAFSFATTLRVKRALLASAAPHPITTVSGGFGECYRDFFWAQEFGSRGRRQSASIERIIRYRLDTSLDRMDYFTTDWRPEWRARLREYLGNIIEPYRHERNTAQLDVVYLRKMAGMIGAFSTPSARFSHPLVPFASVPALEVAMSVPPRWRYEARLLRHIASKLAPRLAGYSTLAGCPCVPVGFQNWYQFLPRYARQAQRLIRKASAVWMGSSIFADYVEPEPERNPYLTFLEGETRPGGHLHWGSMETADWYLPDGLSRLLQEAREPGGYHLRRTISRIYTCEAMIRKAEAAISQTSTFAATSASRLAVR